MMTNFVIPMLVLSVVWLGQRSCWAAYLPPSHSDNSTVENSTSATTETRAPTQVTFGPFSDYMLQFVIMAKRIKDSNCSETFLGQDVSRDFCPSDRVTFIQLEASNEGLTSTTNDSLDNAAHKLCAKLPSPRPNEITLGYDIVLYKRPPLKENEENQENATQTIEVFLIEQVNIEQVNTTEQWDQLLGHATIQSEATGWQVFHTDRRHNENQQELCVNLYIRIEENSTVQLLNTSMVKEIFVLNPISLKDTTKSPLLVRYTQNIFVTPINYQPPFPFFTKRSVQQLQLHSTDIPRQTKTCSLQSYNVSLPDHFGLPIISPVTANLGTCTRQSDRQKMNNEDKIFNALESLRADEFDAKTSDEDRNTESPWQCVPAEFEDLHVLVLVDDVVELIVLSDAVVTKCVAISSDSVDQ